MENQNKPQNPLAFPQDANACLDEYRGMTLRDYFAAKAMQGIISVYDKRAGFDTMEKESIHLAKTSYEIADAMLKEREKL